MLIGNPKNDCTFLCASMNMFVRYRSASNTGTNIIKVCVVERQNLVKSSIRRNGSQYFCSQGFFIDGFARLNHFYINTQS